MPYSTLHPRGCSLVRLRWAQIGSSTWPTCPVWPGLDCCGSARLGARFGPSESIERSDPVHLTCNSCLIFPAGRHTCSEAGAVHPSGPRSGTHMRVGGWGALLNNNQFIVMSLLVIAGEGKFHNSPTTATLFVSILLHFEWSVMSGRPMGRAPPRTAPRRYLR